MVKEEKLTEEEKLENQLRNFSIEEIESYIELLLTKSLDSLEKEDLQSYNNIERTLNSSIILFSSKVRNFNLLYTRIKLRVANKFLKRFLNANNISVLEDVSLTGSFLTVEEATVITKAEDYKRYLEAKGNVERELKPTDIYSNERYSFISDKWELVDNENNYSVIVEGLFNNIEIFKAFITKDSAILTDKEQELLNKEPSTEAIVHEEKKLKLKEDKPYSYNLSNYSYSEDDNTFYYNENDVFLVHFEDINLSIYHKRTGTKTIIEVYSEKWFFIDFCNYCMGKVGTIIKQLEEE